MDEDHSHCMSCVNQRCMIRPQLGFSCDLIACPQVCGAIFHFCKAEEHHLLCPLVRVPCLNSAYGCPATVVRQQMYAHLEVCPAGVVCCTMELSAVAPPVEKGSLSPESKDVRVREPTVPFSSQSSSSAEFARERIINGIIGLNEQHDTKLHEATLETARSLATALELVSSASAPDSCTEGMRTEATLQARRLGRFVQCGLSANVCQEERDPNSSVTECLETNQKGTSVHISKGVAHGHGVLQERGLVPESHKPEWMPHSCQGFDHDQSLCRSQAKMQDKAGLEHGDNPMELEEIDVITAEKNIFCLEKSRDSQKISDSFGIDGRHVDFGTQTFSFLAASLENYIRVGDMAFTTHPGPDGYLWRGLVLKEICAQSFRRDQFSSHFTNVHGDIQPGLNGWIAHRCPLAFYGCPFSQQRFYPSRPGAKLIFDRRLRSFGVQPCPGSKPSGDSQSDLFSGLPHEILWHITGFLDSFSLCQLSLVSRTMRDVCSGLLQTRGIVEVQWEKTQCSSGRMAVSWQITHKRSKECTHTFEPTDEKWQLPKNCIKNEVWRFSTAFTPVLKWGCSDVPSMAKHLQKCHYNTVEHRAEPVALPALCPKLDGFLLSPTLRHVSPYPRLWPVPD
ncbi:F-box only protein 30-like isoform X1 [Nerophis ophidion]|uniref:F-box only protein 30-like isoform X1 n=1 Tax=Nerophis ophidion TaxID=159077 RepID=UPI002AE08016|nr:F-box only protein 30-like isoform X1 [Nerophis ophidion]XP_061756553.1 F-box only protein 30-like isoform X1 [Nerophis ophidion]XP_061756554.1 F-box only protein 30-like isoform X1 [Nerophis ophidion]